VAELSFTQEVGLFSATSRRLEIRRVERQFRGQAQQARRALELMAQAVEVEWEFRVARGLIASELLSVASETDLVILGKAGWSPLGRHRLGSTARHILVQGSQLTLLLQPGTRLGLPLLAIFDGSMASEKALFTVRHLIQGKEGEVVVLILAGEVEKAERLKQTVSSVLDNPQLEIRLLWQKEITGGRLARFVNSEGFRLTVIPNASTPGREAILSILDRTECPVLLVR
jgi:nucleotide-binding universal stress UspA family protein